MLGAAPVLDGLSLSCRARELATHRIPASGMLGIYQRNLMPMSVSPSSSLNGWVSIG